MAKYRNISYISGFTNPKIPKLSKGFILEVKDAEIVIWHSSLFYAKHKEIITFDNLDDVRAVTSQTRKALSAKKALVGTMLLPGAGTIIGAAMGGKQKDFRLIITHTEGSRKVTLELETKQCESIEHAILECMEKNGYYFDNCGQEGATSKPATLDYVNELRELADLKEKGILSQEEFETQKARILADQE